MYVYTVHICIYYTHISVRGSRQTIAISDPTSIRQMPQQPASKHSMPKHTSCHMPKRTSCHMPKLTSCQAHILSSAHPSYDKPTTHLLTDHHFNRSTVQATYSQAVQAPIPLQLIDSPSHYSTSTDQQSKPLFHPAIYSRSLDSYRSHSTHLPEQA